MDGQKWAPFQSEKMREVCEHLTAEERREVARRAAGWGRTVGWSFAVPFGFVFAFGIWPTLAARLELAYDFGFQIPFLPAIGIMAIIVAICVPATIRFRKKQKEFFASTEWTRTQGYTVDDL